MILFTEKQFTSITSFIQVDLHGALYFEELDYRLIQF